MIIDRAYNKKSFIIHERLHAESYTYSFTRIKSFTESTRTRVYLSPQPHFFSRAALFFNENSHNVKRGGGLLPLLPSSSPPYR